MLSPLYSRHTQSRYRPPFAPSCVSAYLWGVCTKHQWRVRVYKLLESYKHNTPMARKPRPSRSQNPFTRQSIEDEQATGERFCSKCDHFLPLDQFRKTGKRLFMCLPHLRERARIETMGTLPKHAFNNLRCKARPDMFEFGHTKMEIKRKEVIEMLTEEQITNFRDYCLMPRRPDRPLSMFNSILLTSPQRMYLIGRWRKTRDAIKYMYDLNHILKPATFPEDDDPQRVCVATRMIRAAEEKNMT